MSINSSNVVRSCMSLSNTFTDRAQAGLRVHLGVMYDSSTAKVLQLGFGNSTIIFFLVLLNNSYGFYFTTATIFTPKRILRHLNLPTFKGKKADKIDF